MIQIPFLFLIFLPDQPNQDWQKQLLYFIHNDLHITIGANGPIPLYTVLVSLYLIALFLFLYSYFIFRRNKMVDIGSQFQAKVYRFIDEKIVDSKYTRWLKSRPIIRMIFIYAQFAMILGFNIWHLMDQDISFHRVSRGGMIASAYQHRLGVIVWEYFFQCFFVATLYLTCIYTVYIFNFCRGFGWGNQISLEPEIVKQTTKKMTKNNMNKRKPKREK